MHWRDLLIIPLAIFMLQLCSAETTLPLTKVQTSDASVSASSLDTGALQIQVAPNSKGYPGATILPPDGKFFDLSAHSRVEAIVRNTSDRELPVMVRVDNPGNWKDEPFSTESIQLGPGDTGTVVVFFGYRYGFQKAFPLDPAQVSQILIFTKGSSDARSIVVESLIATGAPDETPDAWKNPAPLTPDRGVLLDASNPISSNRQLAALSESQVSLSESKSLIRIDYSGPGQSVQFSPVSGLWNLRDATQLELEIANTGDTTASPQALVKSRGGATEVAQASIDPGKSAKFIVPFAASQPWTPDSETDHSGFDSYRVENLSILSGDQSASQSLEVRSIQATAPPADLPDWIGQRPPVEGDWVLTFREEFEENTVDESKWNVYTDNYWDKRSHFSKDNVLLEDGLAKLRFEHKTGRHNDDPAGKETPWQTGFLDTYDKWSQRYGYFEARMKLPTAPGLWPAFWAMPDRGPADGPKWKRSQTTRGGMEFDIVEHLTRWGPHRYNVAFHWDGYGKGHQHSGTSGIYVDHDAEGFITAGWLWLPGKSVYYCNGKEVARWESERISNVPSILMFTHVSGGWDNDALDPANLSADFVIDYVKAWQRRDLVE